MKQKDIRTLIISTVLCGVLFGIAVAINNMGGGNADTYIPLYVIATILNAVLNLGLSSNIVMANGAKKLVALGKWITPITGLAYLIPQIYLLLFPAKSIMETFVYIFLGIIFIISGNYFPKNHINPYIGLKFPWLFHDEEGWYKTHKLGSYTWVLSGAAMILHPLHNLAYVTVPLIILLAGVVPFIYSLILCFKKKTN